MSVLSDALPGVSEVVDIGGAEVPVYGISLRGIFGLVMRFPDLQTLIDGEEEIGGEKLIAACLAAVGPVIAAGTGSPGDPEAEAIADRLPIGAQVPLLTRILKRTFPNGVPAVAKQLEELKAVLQAEPAAAGPESTPAPRRKGSSKASSG